MCQANRGQLGVVSYHDQFAVFTATDVSDQIVQQMAAAENRGIPPEIGEHRSLVHDEYGIPFFVYIQFEPDPVGSQAFLTVDLFVYRIGMGVGRYRENFSRPAGGGQ